VKKCSTGSRVKFNDVSRVANELYEYSKLTSKINKSKTITKYTDAMLPIQTQTKIDTLFELTTRLFRMTVNRAKLPTENNRLITRSHDGEHKLYRSIENSQLIGKSAARLVK
jgi:hypothetical protein